VSVTIKELDAAGIGAAADELAQLLLDAHDANMALGISGPLTRERAREAWLETAGLMSPSDRVLLVGREGGEIVGTVQVVRAHASNARHRAEIVRLAVRADQRGRGLGRQLLDAAVERARSMELRLLYLTTHADTGSDRFYEAVGWTRSGIVPLYSERPDGTLADNSFFHLVL